MANIFNIDELSGLTEAERKYALEILQQYSEAGSSELLNKIIYADYEEIPVHIETFLLDPNYLGKGLVNEEGKFTVYPYWVDTLKEIFPDPLKPAVYNTLALSGAIGLGKSFVAVLCGLYELYRMLCLKDPYLYFGLQPIDKITFAFMNITMDAAKGVAWDKCQQLLQSSPWFMARGTVSKSINPEWSPPKGIELLYGSQSRHIIGRAVYWAFFDEISFQPNQDVNKQKDLGKKDYIKIGNKLIKKHNLNSLPIPTKKCAYIVDTLDIAKKLFSKILNNQHILLLLNDLPDEYN